MATTTSPGAGADAGADTTIDHTTTPTALLHSDNHTNRRIFYTNLVEFPLALGHATDPAIVDSTHKFLCPISDFRTVLLDMMIGVARLFRTLQQDDVAGRG